MVYQHGSEVVIKPYFSSILETKDRMQSALMADSRDVNSHEIGIKSTYLKGLSVLDVCVCNICGLRH